MYDIDGNGTIEFTEFMILFHIMSDGTPEEVSFSFKKWKVNSIESNNLSAV